MKIKNVVLCALIIIFGIVLLTPLPGCSNSPGSSGSSSSSPPSISVVGNWNLTILWSGGHSPESSTITFAADGSFSDSEGGSGTWSLNGNSISWVYPSPHTTYTGTGSSTSMSGTMNSPVAGPGTWTAYKL